MKKFKVGVIGNGFVGEAISFAFSSVSDLYVYDTDPLKSLDDLESVHSCDYVFICVPTPMFQDGSQDLSYVESTFEKATSKPVYILKSTVLPGTTERLSKKYSNIQIIFSPEFLRESNALQDCLNPSRIVISNEGDKKEFISEFLKFREDTVIKRIKFDLKRAEERAHILIGLATAVENIDEIIKIIKNSKDTETAKKNLLSKKWKIKKSTKLISLIEKKKNIRQKRDI